MKIYFAGSIRGGRDDQAMYSSIISELGKHGVVLTEHVGNATLTDKGEEGVTEKYIFRRDMDWVKEADVLVAEVTTPSMGVGYEIGQAESMQKPILCLYRSRPEGKKISGMILGNPYLQIFEYKSLQDVTKILKDFFSTRNKAK